MKQKALTAAVWLLVLSMLCTAALAQSGTGQGNGSPGTGGAQTQNGLGDPLFVNAEAIESAILQMEDGDAKDELLRLLERYRTAAAGESLTEERQALEQLRIALMNANVPLPGGEAMNGYDRAMAYGRYMDTAKVKAAIMLVQSEETQTMLNQRLQAYQDALQSEDPVQVRETLQTLLEAMEQTRLQLNEQAGMAFFEVTQGVDLDTIAVENAILTLPQPQIDELLPLLDAYMMAANGGGLLAAQEALTALMNALQAAGL